MSICLIDPDNPAIDFPDIKQAAEDPNGLLAIGGNLSVDNLLRAYRSGVFPWYDQNSPVLWWSPDPREILLRGDQHWSRSMRKVQRAENMHITSDMAFTEVIQACSRTNKNQSDIQNDAWITEEIQQAYIELHRAGFAHSLEVWQQDQLVGGLYGVRIGAAFCGESMFSRVSNSSKLAFLSLAEYLFAAGFQFIDCQFETEHLRSLGTQAVSRSQYKKRLLEALQNQPSWPSSFQSNLG